ncbi:MAG: putative membrane protein YdjX (TVP38/TMEM64 family) [Myxococcota bacterium]|jgi:uncharacterized membrane protein YdjX (TVP38/TMEM64 family)
MTPAPPTAPPAGSPEGPSAPGEGRSRTRRAAWVGAGMLVMMVAMAVLWRFPGTLAVVVNALEWLRGAGLRGVFVYLLVHLTCSLLLIPASLIESGGGYAYGVLIGYPLTTLISLTDSTVAFLIGRYVLSPLVGPRVRRTLWFRALDGVLRQQGTYAVVLLRLSPVAPFNVISYGLGFTRVRLRDVMLGTWLGSIPTLFFFVYIGSTLAHASEIVDGTGPPLWAHVAGALLTLGVTVGITRIGQRAFAEAMRKGQAQLLDEDAG